MSKDAEDIRAARALIEQGWTKGYRRKTDESGATRYCATGALDAVGASPRARNLVLMAANRGFGSLPGFNDDKHTNKDMVVGAFSSAIASA